MSLLWVCPTPDQNPDDADVQHKLSSASVRAVFDFGNFDELEAAGTTLTGTPTVSVSPTGPTVSAVSLVTGPDPDDAEEPDVSYRVRCTISGGTAGEKYKVTCVAATAAGETLYGRGILGVA